MESELLSRARTLVHYFDASCRLGRYNTWSGTEPVTPEELLSVMDHYGIHEALVVDSLAEEYHPVDGNERVLQLTADHPRLHPAWAALPPRSGELPLPSDLVAQMEARGVRALFLYPNQYGFSLEEWCIDELLAPLAERGVPLFICPNSLTSTAQLTGVGGARRDLTDWRAVVRICQTFPDLPVVVTERRIRHSQRMMYQALDACPNLFVDMSALWLHHSVEFIVREWGARRLLFGSGLPESDPGAALGQINFAHIAEEELALVAGGNLRRLLSWSEKMPFPEVEVDFPEPVDELHDIARNRGSTRGQGILDCHGHLGRVSDYHIPDGSVAELLAEMDRIGLERALVFSTAFRGGDETYGNDTVADAIRRHPDRFVGFVLPNLNRPPEEIRREMERGFAMGMRGVKLHPAGQGYSTTGPHVEVACSFANERKAFIVNHNWGSAERMQYLCQKYPDACFITGHSSVGLARVARSVANLYIGSCTLVKYGITEELVDKAGADRVLFGSDLSDLPITWGYGPLLYARIPPEAKRLILGGNLVRLLEKYGLRR